MTDQFEPKPVTEPNHLKEIAEHLKSIRSMLTFFTILTVVGLIVGGCNILLSF